MLDLTPKPCFSKHEQREETTLFPVWTGALNKAPEAARAALLVRVLGVLEGDLGTLT
jgi:hypothetical protein